MTLPAALETRDQAIDLTYRLNDRYAREKGPVFLTGIQALVRLPMLQAQRDKAAGLNTAGFVSGYRGSPLGAYDQALWQASDFLKSNGIEFVPAINEELAATAVLGTQQVSLSGEADKDGVFAIWYGKGPGVDRAGDALKHGNALGSSPQGGVLVVAGDDHGAVSSSMGHQSEQAMIGWMMPVLNPANIQEYLELGLMGIALSRYSGCWVGFKAISETVEGGAVVDVDPTKPRIVTPGGVGEGTMNRHIRWPEPFKDMERRMHDVRLPAVLEFARANKLNRVVMDSPAPRLGIAATGKAYADLRQALQDMGIDEEGAAALGIRLFKIALSWPLEPQSATSFADGLEEILVVEEKRPVIENQLRDLLYDLPDSRRPRVVGKSDGAGATLLPSIGELSPEMIGRVLLERIGEDMWTPRMRAYADRLQALDGSGVSVGCDLPQRTPYFCSGCPHNRSTKVPDGSRAQPGIGCHFMAVNMNRNTAGVVSMGGEGVNWIGQAPFSREKHVFQNLGDGTFYHSGLLAIRQAVAAGVNITYKILFNDAVAMTGGQPVDGTLTVPQISRLVHGEGVRRIAVVSDEPDKYPVGAHFAPDVSFHHRDDLDDVQRELREVEGVSVLIYDQTCAAEKRRRRKRGTFPDPARRVFINDMVCEGCGDCSVQSNCVSIVPVETDQGRKRAVEQTSCNKDYSCVDGFCPSFVTVEGGTLRKSAADIPARREKDIFAALPQPQSAGLDKPYNVLVTGVGGTGVVTIGAMITMAAHLEGKGASVLDFTGFAQKGGAVLSHVRLAARPDDLHAARIGRGEADALIGCDLVVSASTEALATMRTGHTRAVLNSHQMPTAAFTLNPDLPFDAGAMTRAVRHAVGDDRFRALDAFDLASKLFGDGVAANVFLLGAAWQHGLVPLSLNAMMRAIELNRVAVDANKRAFTWGRVAAHDKSILAGLLDDDFGSAKRARNLDELVIANSWELAEYQNDALAGRYRDLVRRVADTERAKVGGTELAAVVAKSYFKLLAYKDEYEVARLFSDGRFAAKLKQQFDGDVRIAYHMAPPLFSRPDPKTGRPKKVKLGGWMKPVLRLLALGKGLRGTPLDLFGYQAERREERRLIKDFELTVAVLLETLTAARHPLAVQIAALPLKIRGYGPVKANALSAFETEHAALMERYALPEEQIAVAAE